MPLTFRRRNRMSSSKDFQAVFNHKLAKPAGPLVVHARPTDRPDHRLGLSIGRRFGPAHTRNALKRHLREAFRLTEHTFPRPPSANAYDLVITARPHAGLQTDDYARLIAQALAAIDRTVRKRTDHAQD
jgi:ribonuclease P protein component